jgi:hypothetical protein
LAAFPSARGGAAECTGERNGACIIRLRDEQRGKFASNANALKIIDELFEKPIVTVTKCSRISDVTFVTANSLVASMEKAGLLNEVADGARKRVFKFESYPDLFASESSGDD